MWLMRPAWESARPEKPGSSPLGSWPSTVSTSSQACWRGLVMGSVPGHILCPLPWGPTALCPGCRGAALYKRCKFPLSHIQDFGLTTTHFLLKQQQWAEYTLTFFSQHWLRAKSYPASRWPREKWNTFSKESRR